VAPRSSRSADARQTGIRQPAAPVFDDPQSPAVLPDDDLADEGVYESLTFDDMDLSDREAAGAQIDQCRYANVGFGRTRLRRAVISHTIFDRCDLANVRARECSLIRTAVSASRMTGLSWLDGSFRDVVFDRCRIDLASFRATRFKDVVFTGCRLEQADFGEADLRGARFEDCDLTGAQFSNAQLTGARFADCALIDIGGVTSLRGAIIKAADVLALTYLLAAAIGITIDDGSGLS
jgi:uncharacterized protein YjbI with pentapeptide repeats